MSSTVSWDDVRGGGTAAQRQLQSRADNEEKGALTEENKIRVTSGNRRVASQKRLQAALQRINRCHCSTVLNFLTPELYLDRGRPLHVQVVRATYSVRNLGRNGNN